MVELLILFLGICLAGNYSYRRRKGLKLAEKVQKVKEAQLQAEADLLLWKLLKDEDPAWLVAMGIEPPETVRLDEERRKMIAKAQAEGRHADLRALKPLTVFGGNTFDRQVEAQLEQKLLRPLEADFLRAMQQGKMDQAELLRNQLAQQEQRFQQQQHDRRMDGMMGMGSLLGAMGGEMFLGRRKH